VWRVADATFAGLHTLHSMGAVFGTLNECALDRIPEPARAIFYPVPYQIPDDVYAKLKAWVAQGGTLYVSGDVSYDALRRRTLTDRLTELCGVKLAAERYPNIQASKETILSAKLGGEDLAVNPALKVEPAGAEVLLAADDGTPVLLQNRLGQGRVFFSTWPLELDDVFAGDTVVRNAKLYGLVLKAANVLPPWADQLGRAALPVTVPLAGDAMRAEVYVNTTDRPLPAAGEAAKVGLQVGPNRSGLAVWGRDGSLLALETADAAHHSLFALDRQDVRRSKRLCVLPLEEGEVRLTTNAAWTQPVAVVGEVVGGRWVQYETLPVEPGGTLAIPIDVDRRLAIVLVTEKDQVAECARSVVKSLGQF
jgi:hypothetical protein